MGARGNQPEMWNPDMVLSSLEDDMISERRNHSGLADTAAIAACLLAALIVHHHTVSEHPLRYSVAKASHMQTLPRPTHIRRV